MNTLKAATLLALPVLFLLSCNTRKTGETNPKEDTLVVKPTASATHEVLNLQAISEDYMQNVKQEFTVKEKRRTVITAKGGLRVTVDPADLVKENGRPVDGDIQVRIIELTNSDDLFYSNAATVSDGRLLSSGGSYYVDMSCNGDRLKLKEDKLMMVDFPVIRKEDMELFYGNRDENGDMNWRKMNLVLTRQEETISFTDSSYSDVPYNPSLEEFKTGRIFSSMNDPVYYYGKEITLQRFVDTLNAVKPVVYLETISFWPKNLPTNQVLDTNFLIATYGPMKQYILRNYKQYEQEEQERERRKLLNAARMIKWESNTLAGQLQKYYAPIGITNLGWINCDRFYQQQQAEMELEMPITLNNSQLQYFLLYKSINGMMQNRIIPDSLGKISISGLPVGVRTTLVGFVKKDGVIYQAKEEFTVENGKKIKPGFTVISQDELKKIFGRNVKA